MLGIAVKLKVKPGKGPEMERVFKDMQAGVYANEADINLQYEMFISKEDPDVYWVFEQFIDEAALGEHMKRDYFIKGYEAQQQYLDGPPEVHMLTRRPLNR